MNILIGKIGKSIKFKNLHINTGDDTSMILFSTMSRMMPEHNFYFCGPNDLSKLSDAEYEYLFPNKNVFSVYVKGKHIEGWPDDIVTFDPIVDNIKSQGINIDFGLFFVGFVGKTCLCNVTKKDNGDYYKALNAFKSYAGPYVNTLNRLGCPVYTIAEDARYITVNTIDFYNRSRMIFTQMSDRTIQPIYDFIKSYEDHSTHNVDIPCKYTGVEKIFLMGIDKDWKNNIDVDRKINNTTNPKCIVLSNGHGTKKVNCGGTYDDGRLPGYKEYIIDGLKNTPYADTKIYGKWSEKALTDYPYSIQDKKIVELDNEIADAKYSLVYSIIPGFVTIKPYEMIVKGLIPFIHPDYDTERLLNLPEYLYIKNPQDFANKMAELDADDNKYRNLLNECIDAIKPEYLDGSYVVNNIMNNIAKDINFEYTDHVGVPSIFNHFGHQVFDFEKLAPAVEKKTKKTKKK